MAAKSAVRILVFRPPPHPIFFLNITREKDLAQDVDVAEDVLGAAEGGSAKELIVVTPPYAALRRHVKDEHLRGGEG